jgi:hypothetical protein
VVVALLVVSAVALAAKSYGDQDGGTPEAIKPLGP